MPGFGHRLLRTAIVCASAAILSACASGSSGLTTGSLLPSVGGPKPTDAPTERAMQVAVTSARAMKCGYNFNPVNLKSSYLAYESTQDGSAEKIAKLEKAYDFTERQAGSKMGPSDEYCTEEQTGKIKSDLTRHMAGDFSPSAKKAEAGLLDILQAGSQANQPMDRHKILCPKGNCPPPS